MEKDKLQNKFMIVLLYKKVTCYFISSYSCNIIHNTGSTNNNDMLNTNVQEAMTLSSVEVGNE